MLRCGQRSKPLQNNVGFFSGMDLILFFLHFVVCFYFTYIFSSLVQTHHLPTDLLFNLDTIRIQFTVQISLLRVILFMDFFRFCIFLASFFYVKSKKIEVK